MAVIFCGAIPGSHVTIKKDAPQVKELVLDISHPPEEIRDLIKGHQAYTRCAYSLTWSASDDLKNQTPVDGKIRATVIITDLEVNLTLATTYYLPTGVSKQVRDHEGGHKRIGELIYESADLDARRIAEAMIGQSFTGTGANLEDAEADAERVAGKELLDKYLAVVIKEAQQVQDAYDEITDKGTNTKISVADAIRLSFEKCKLPLATKH